LGGGNREKNEERPGKRNLKTTGEVGKKRESGARPSKRSELVMPGLNPAQKGRPKGGGVEGWGGREARDSMKYEGSSKILFVVEGAGFVGGGGGM